MQADLIYAVEWSDSLAAGSWRNAGVTEKITADSGTERTVKATAQSHCAVILTRK